MRLSPRRQRMARLTTATSETPVRSPAAALPRDAGPTKRPFQPSTEATPAANGLILKPIYYSLKEDNRNRHHSCEIWTIAMPVPAAVRRSLIEILKSKLPHRKVTASFAGMPPSLARITRFRCGLLSNLDPAIRRRRTAIRTLYSPKTTGMTMPCGFRTAYRARAVSKLQPGDIQPGIRAMTLISKSNPASQLTPIAVQFG